MRYEGITDNEAALLLSIIGNLSVDKSLIRVGIKAKTTRIKRANRKEWLEKILSLYMAGWSAKDIAREVDSPLETVYHSLQRMGYRPRWSDARRGTSS